MTDAPRRKIKQLEVMVSEVIYETPDTRTLVLFTGNDPLEYKAGHFLTIAPQQFPALDRWTAYLEHLKGKKEPPRAYSMASAPHEKHLAITIKEELYIPGVTLYPPLLSPFLALRTSVGTEMVITGFTGPYTMPDDLEAHTDHVLHVCAGSGIVPSFSIIKDSLLTGRKLKQTLVYSNKTWEDTIFARELLELQRKYPQQLRVVFTLTRETDASRFSETVVKGRISKDLLSANVEDASHQYVFACGPSISAFDKAAAKAAGVEPAPRFLETVIPALGEIGFTPNRIKRESYG